MKLAERRAGLVGPRIPIASDCHHRAVTVPRVQLARGGASPWIAVCGVTSVGSVVFLVVAVFAALLTFADVPLAAPRGLALVAFVGALLTWGTFIVSGFTMGRRRRRTWSELVKYSEEVGRYYSNNHGDMT